MGHRRIIRATTSYPGPSEDYYFALHLGGTSEPGICDTRGKFGSSGRTRVTDPMMVVVLQVG